MIKKVVIYPRVIVYQNAIPNHKDYIDLLEFSQKNDPKFLFKSWDDWYGFGLMMNLGMTRDHKYESDWDGNPIDLSDEYAKKQSDFLLNLDNVFHSVTKDYINDYDIKLPNWHSSGFSICKYKETAKENNLAMHYHTDYVGATADDPGLKFAITCTMYLNDDYEGGGLSFLEEESGEVIHYKPKAGDVVVFPSGDPITGASRYFHGVDKISSGDKYLVRTFWQYQYDGSEYWHEGFKKYGKEEWQAKRKLEIRASLDSGKWHRYVIGEGESPDYSITKSKPSVGKVTQTNQSQMFFKLNNTDTKYED